MTSTTTPNPDPTLPLTLTLTLTKGNRRPYISLISPPYLPCISPQVTWVIRKFMGGTAQLLSCSFVTKNASENVRKVTTLRVRVSQWSGHG